MKRILLCMLLCLFVSPLFGEIIPGATVTVDHGDDTEYIYETLLPDATATFTLDTSFTKSISTATLVSGGTIWNTTDGIIGTIQDPPCAVVIFSTFTNGWASVACNTKLLATVSGTAWNDEFVGDEIYVTTTPITTTKPIDPRSFGDIAFKYITQVKIRAGGVCTSGGLSVTANPMKLAMGRVGNLVAGASSTPRKVKVQNADATDVVYISDQPLITSTMPHYLLRNYLVTSPNHEYVTETRSEIWAQTADSSSGSVITGVVENRK